MSPTVKTRTLFCVNCGGPVELRGFGHTLSVVCPQCHTVLDVSTPLVQILQLTQEALERKQPKIPLGTRGQIENVTWEIIGFQVRQIEVELVLYSWDEYLLFNPYYGFRYLSEYQGHWNFIRTLPMVPQTVAGTQRQAQGISYKHFQHCTATTIFVLGEFPWRAQHGDTATVDDYIAPPRILSSEQMGGEVLDKEIVWSVGEYWTGDRIWKAFHLPGRPDPAVGVYANQPSPHKAQVAAMWSMFWWMMVGLAAIMLYFMVSTRREIIYSQPHGFSTGIHGEPSFVTPVFELKGHPANVEVYIHTNLDNNWAYFNLALISQDTGRAWDYGREISIYTDDDWTPDAQGDLSIIPEVPAGHYYLRVEPEMDSKKLTAMNYTLTIRHDMPNYAAYFVAALLLIIPPIFAATRIGSFETARWRESDFGPSKGSK